MESFILHVFQFIVSSIKYLLDTFMEKANVIDPAGIM